MGAGCQVPGACGFTTNRRNPQAGTRYRSHRRVASHIKPHTTSSGC